VTSPASTLAFELCKQEEVHGHQFFTLDLLLLKLHWNRILSKFNPVHISTAYIGKVVPVLG
jgi:hypothetical protein